jgi:hypothetical protein
MTPPGLRDPTAAPGVIARRRVDVMHPTLMELLWMRSWILARRRRGRRRRTLTLTLTRVGTMPRATAV